MGLISRQPNACLASHEQTPETIILGFNVWKAKYSKQLNILIQFKLQY